MTVPEEALYVYMSLLQYASAGDTYPFNMKRKKKKKKKSQHSTRCENENLPDASAPAYFADPNHLTGRGTLDFQLPLR